MSASSNSIAINNFSQHLGANFLFKREDGTPMCGRSDLNPACCFKEAMTPYPRIKEGHRWVSMRCIPCEFRFGFHTLVLDIAMMIFYLGHLIVTPGFSRIL